MQGINPNLIRSSFLGKYIKELLDEKRISITEISEKIKLSRPSVSNALNGKIVGSDNMYTKIMKAVGLTNNEINEVFKKADREEFKYKYGEDITDPNLLEDIDFDVALRREYGKELNQSTIDKIKEFIEFVKNK